MSFFKSRNNVGLIEYRYMYFVYTEDHNLKIKTKAKIDIVSLRSVLS